MIDLLMFIVLICLMAYFYNHPISQSNNAASTLLQIWTGSCNLSCRQSGYSSFSGMSGLNQPPEPPSPETPAGGKTQGNVEQQRVANTASNCVCQPCPCGHIETIIRTCRPATDIYVQNMELLGFYLAASFALISDTYEKLSNAMRCGTSCQRHAEYVQTADFVFESCENLTFDREKTEGNKKGKTLFPKISEMLHLKTRSEMTLKARSETGVKETIETMNQAQETPKTDQNNSQDQNENAGPSAPTQIDDVCPKSQLKTDEMPECSSCPRCVKDGKVCISKCPKAKNK